MICVYIFGITKFPGQMTLRRRPVATGGGGEGDQEGPPAEDRDIEEGPAEGNLEEKDLIIDAGCSMTSAPSQNTREK